MGFNEAALGPIIVNSIAFLTVFASTRSKCVNFI